MRGALLAARLLLAAGSLPAAPSHACCSLGACCSLLAACLLAVRFPECGTVRVAGEHSPISKCIVQAQPFMGQYRTNRRSDGPFEADRRRAHTQEVEKLQYQTRNYTGVFEENEALQEKLSSAEAALKIKVWAKECVGSVTQGGPGQASVTVNAHSKGAG
eukprot:365620-Chlamydomonas_euryale.AAC.6